MCFGLISFILQNNLHLYSGIVLVKIYKVVLRAESVFVERYKATVKVVQKAQY